MGGTCGDSALNLKDRVAPSAETHRARRGDGGWAVCAAAAAADDNG